MPLTTSSLLNALDGVAYTTDAEGFITGIGKRGWERALRASDSTVRPDPDQFIGHSLWDCISGDAVRDSYRRHMERAADPRRHGSVFQYRCDTPGLIRVMRMVISALRDPDGALIGFLFQSVPMHVTERVPVALYAFDAPEGDAPFLGMCSYCQNVRFPAGSTEGDGTWVDAVEYYRRGGDNTVVISHGVCPTCFETVVQDNLRSSLESPE